MALRKSFDTKMGVSGDYINFDVSFKSKTDVVLRMKYWKDQDTRNIEGALPLNDLMSGSSEDRITGFNCLYEFTYDLESAKNIYEQAYDYLKTLPEFSGAEDC
jgi:hypothetical protein